MGSDKRPWTWKHLRTWAWRGKGLPHPKHYHALHMAGLLVRFPVTEQGSGGQRVFSQARDCSTWGTAGTDTSFRSRTLDGSHSFCKETAQTTFKSRAHQLKLISGRWWAWEGWYEVAIERVLVGRGGRSNSLEGAWQQGYPELGRSQNWGRTALRWEFPPPFLQNVKDTFETGLGLSSGRGQHSLPASAHS